MSKTTIEIKGTGARRDATIKVLSREEVEKILDEVNAEDIYKQTRRLAESYTSISGRAITFIDATTGEIKTEWLDWNSRETTMLEVVLEYIDTPMPGLEDVDLLDSTGKEFDEYMESNLSVEEFIIRKYGKDELKDRIETAIDCIAMENELDWNRIEEQLGTLYSYSI